MVLVATSEQMSATSAPTTLLAVLAVMATGYVLSVVLHPWTTCRRCNGTPRSYGTVFTGAFGLCSSCGGSGRQLRLGARLLGIGKS
jgi:DnaJ-class molecular chaperone